METAQYYVGTVKEVLNTLTYEILLDMPGIISGARGVPFRGEIDEPQEGNLILCLSLDPRNNSLFLFQKLKENDFIGFRSNGKMVNITPDYIDVCVYSKNLKYPDGYVPSGDDVLSNIRISSSGEIQVNSATEIKITSDSGVQISTGQCKVTATDTLSLEAPKIKIKGNIDMSGGKLTASGVCGTSSSGPFNRIGVCPYTGLPHGFGTCILK